MARRLVLPSAGLPRPECDEDLTPARLSLKYRGLGPPGRVLGRRAVLCPGAPRRMTFHAQVHIAASDGRQADVDAAMAPLISVLWRAAYETASSCEDWGAAYRDMPAHTVGMAGVGFDSERDLRRFERVVGAGGMTIRTSDEDRAVAAEGRASAGIVLFPAADLADGAARDTQAV